MKKKKSGEINGTKEFQDSDGKEKKSSSYFHCSISLGCKFHEEELN